MPFRFFCGKCGYILLEEKRPQLVFGSGRNASIPYLKRIKEKLGEACPKCNHKLEFPPKNITVTPIKEEANR